MSDPFKVLSFLSAHRHAGPLTPIATPPASVSGVVPRSEHDAEKTAKILNMPSRPSGSIVARPGSHYSGQQVIARVIENQVKRIFPKLSSAAQAEMATHLKGVLQDDPYIQAIASKIS